MGARVTHVSIHLTADESDVVTEYTLAPIHVYKERGTAAFAVPGTTATFTVEQYGGSLTTADGLRLSTTVNIFPEAESFRAGEEVFVFLNHQSNAKTYIFTAGEFGAYRIRAGVISPMTKHAASRRGDQPIAASAFVADVQGGR